MENGQTVALSSITQGAGALLCVSSNHGAEESEFLKSDGNSVDNSAGFYVTRGDHVISLSRNSSSEEVTGEYCCDFYNNTELACVHIVNS